MRIDALVFEIGSTTTMANAFDNLADRPVFLGQGMAPTTVSDGDVTLGLNRALADLKTHLNVDTLSADKTYATASAAGGLKMSVHGLVYDMTVKAAKEAALGAGANLKMITAGELDGDQLNALRETDINIIMIAGGVDHGERKTALANAEKIASLQLGIPVIYAGNIDNQPAIRRIFDDHNQSDRLIITDNVYPSIDVLDVSEARRVIQDVFETHIIHAPGMEKVRDIVTDTIIPTPGAVLMATRMLYETHGDLITLDVGGATTDVHSVTAGNKKIQDMLLSPEPFEKRTVEGDLGVFINKDNIIDLWTLKRLARQMGVEESTIKELRMDYPEIPGKKHLPLVRELAVMALKTAIERHAGTYTSMFGPTGKTTYAEGKDLTEIHVAVGTGGALTRLPDGPAIIRDAFSAVAKNRLVPTESFPCLIDDDYILASAGVLAKDAPDAARTLLDQSLTRRS